MPFIAVSIDKIYEVKDFAFNNRKKLNEIQSIQSTNKLQISLEVLDLDFVKLTCASNPTN